MPHAHRDGGTPVFPRRANQPAGHGAVPLHAEREGVEAARVQVRGDTPHFDYVAGNAASGLAHIATETGVPIAFGVLTTNTVEQAVDRAGAKSGNKGFDAAMTAIEMANLLRTIRQKRQ